MSLTVPPSFLARGWFLCGILCQIIPLCFFTVLVLNLILLTFPVFKHHINGIMLCIFFCVCFFFHSMLLPVASYCSFPCGLYSVYSSFYPDGLTVVSRACLMNRAAMDILSHVFKHDCARVFLEHWVFFKTMQ